MIDWYSFKQMENEPLPNTAPPPAICVTLADQSVCSEETTQQQTRSMPEQAGQKEDTQIRAAQPDVTTVNSGGSTSPSPKLCGYLSKQGGPLKSWKTRWFTFEEKSCQLFYYRTAQDINPLGKVDLSRATFSYPLLVDEGTFHIQTPERTFILKVIVIYER